MGLLTANEQLIHLRSNQSIYPKNTVRVSSYPLQFSRELVSHCMTGLTTRKAKRNLASAVSEAYYTSSDPTDLTAPV